MSLSTRIGVMRCLSRALQIWIPKRVPHVKSVKVVPYSTAVPKSYIDIVDLFADLLRFNLERSESETNIFESTTKELTVRKADDELFRNVNFADKAAAKAALNEILQKNIANKNWNNVARVTEVFMDENIPMERNKMKSLIAFFCNSGYLKGLLHLRVIMCISQPEAYLKEGELLMQLATCYWIAGNSKECFVCLSEFFERYPNLKDFGKMNLKKIIYEAVVKRSEAELKCTVNFVEKYTTQNNDFYFLTVLWNYLFLSQWYADHSLADELLCRHEELRSIMSLMSSSLTRHFLKTDQVNDVYRLMQVFLKYEIMDSYAITSQVLFDYYGEFFLHEKIFHSITSFLS